MILGPITHAAHDTCEACNLREIQTLCGQCPVVELLRRLKDSDRPQILPLRQAARGGSNAARR